MTEAEMGIIRVVIDALNVPRDRLGRLAISPKVADEQLRKLFVALKRSGGSVDKIDQAVMVLQGLIDDPIQSRAAA